MNSLFKRTYAVLVLLMFVGFFVTLFLADNVFEAADGELFQRDASIEARLIETELLKHPSYNWKAMAESYTPVFETTVSMLTISDVESSEYAAMVSLDQDTIVTGQSFEAWWLLHPLPGGELFLLVEEEQSANTLEDWLTLLAPLATIALIVGAALWYISHYIAKPITALSTVARALGEGQLDTRADVGTSEPVRGLALSFNAMADEVQTLINDQRVIIGALPHELRTPISRARFALDMTRSLKTVEALHEQLEKVDDYVMGLESVIEDALSLSRIQLTDALGTSTFSLEDCIAELCELRRSEIAKSLEWNCAVLGPVVGDETLLRLAIGNLIDNGLKYGLSRVRVTCYRKPDGSIAIAVDDDGVGIPEPERAAVFAPFYRLDDSRSRETGGVGLGLAIVAVIARRIQGTVIVSTSEWNGARVQISWPQPA